MDSSQRVNIFKALASQAFEAQELPSVQATTQPFVPPSLAHDSQDGAVDATADAPLTSAAPPSMGKSQSPA